MSARKKFWLRLAAYIAGGFIVLLIAALIVVQTQWFGNVVKDKVIATIEDSTGGKVEIGSFEFNPWNLTVRIRDFVLHGTEPAAAAPLARISLLELRLKLLASFKKVVDLAYLGVSEPRVNLIVNPDGTTNVPSPKVKTAPSQTSPFETVVDLAVGQFRIDNGLLLYSQRASEFSARGEDLHVLLNFNSFNSTYAGRVMIAPLVLDSGTGSPLRVDVNLPVLLEKDAVSISGGRFTTDASQILVNAGLRNLNSPQITARLNANISLAEMQKSFNLPLDLQAHDVPKSLIAELGARYDDQTSSLQVQAAHIVLGQTNFEAAGTLQPAKGEAVQLNGHLALDQLSRLTKLGATQVGGVLDLHGRATTDAKKNYAVDGTINSQALTLRSGATSVSDIHLSTPFYADSYLISLDGLKLSALGGDLNAKIFVEKLQQVSLEGHLNNFSIPVLSRAFAGKQLGYDGVISGLIKARDNLKAKGTKGLAAQTALVITPGTHGVPVNGRIDGNYNGASGVIQLDKSFVALPNSRVDLAGNINEQLNVDLVSHNLNDFKPLVQTLPLKLDGGVASVNAQIKGNLSAPNIVAHAALERFVVNGSRVQNAALDLTASQSAAAISKGVVVGQGLRTNFDASIGLSKWQPEPRSPLSANISVPEADIAEILSLAGQTSLAASGKLVAEVHIRGTYGDPLGNANLQVVNGSAYSQPFDKVQANVDLTHQLITLSSLEIDAAGGQLLASGTFHHPQDSFQIGHADFHVRSNNIQLANIQPLQQRSPGAAGVLQLVADGAADLRAGGEFQLSNISSDFSARNLKVNNQAAGDLVGQARTTNGTVTYNVHSDFAGSLIQVDGNTSLAKGFATKAVASIKNLSVEKALAIAGQGQIPAQGTLSANANVSGTLAKPDAQVELTLTQAIVYTEPVNELTTNVHYSNGQIEVPSLELKIPAGTLHASASYAHDGRFRVQVNSSDMNLSQIRHLTQMEPGVAGGLQLTADVAGDIREQNGSEAVQLSDLSADLNAHNLRANNRDLGELHAVAKTQQHAVNFSFESNLAQTDLRASGETRLSAGYPTRAKLTFANVRYVNLAPFIPSDTEEPSPNPPFDALVDGELNIDGPVLKLDALTGRLQLKQLVIKTNPRGSITGGPALRTVQLQNEGPMILTLNHSVVKVEQFKIQGEKTSLDAAGSISLENGRSPLGLTVKGVADLGVLQNADRDFYSSGDVLLDATLRGSLSKPLVNGRIQLKNANINYTDSPNGLANGNGVILLNGTSATIQNLTGESGGGKIVVTGFAGLGPQAAVFNLRATANKVRTRYSGVSVTSNADIVLAGSSRRSTLSGTVSVQRIAYSANSDAGSILSSASAPPSTPAAPSPLLSSMHLDLRIVTAPDLQVVTTYAQKISLISNLTVHGTAENPGIVGRLNITNGELVFFGNTYTVNVGSVEFYNPNEIKPILNLSLETIAQGVDVTLGVTGPMDDLKLSYRSDPPLTFEQIVQLLATNTTPSDPTIAAHQPTPPQQSASQMGESAVLGQAVANPLASRVQRVFGLTQFRVDPSLSGSNGQPSARVTLQQKITSNLTFTYITDVTQTNSEIVRVQYEVSPKVSAVALRDYNGNVSIEFFYKFQKR